MNTIGFIGLGHMGTPMVTNLLKAGYQVKVYDLVTQTVNQLGKQGAIACRNLREVASDVDVVITMVQTGEQVRDICLTDGGLFVSARQNTLFIESSTIDVKTSRNLHNIAEEKGFHMIDAPVSGGVAGATAATLTFMIGGDKKQFNRAKPILEKLGKNIVYAGPAGNGQVAKMCNNLILGASMIAASEAFVLAEKLGLEAKTFYEIVTHASGQCWSISNYCPAPGVMKNVPSSHDFKAGFTAAMMLKDLKLGQEAASQVNAHTPMGHRAKQLYKQFVESGHEDLDFSGIIKLFQDNEK